MSGLNDEEKRVSIESFMALGVCKELAEAAAGLGWKTPSAIQEQAIPHLLSGMCVPKHMRYSPGL